jgi:hypothetical protein
MHRSFVIHDLFLSRNSVEKSSFRDTVRTPEILPFMFIQMLAIVVELSLLGRPVRFRSVNGELRRLEAHE